MLENDLHDAESKEKFERCRVQRISLVVAIYHHRRRILAPQQRVLAIMSPWAGAALSLRSPSRRQHRTDTSREPFLCTFSSRIPKRQDNTLMQRAGKVRALQTIAPVDESDQPVSIERDG